MTQQDALRKAVLDSLKQGWITRAYLLGLTLIALLTVSSHVLLEQMLGTQQGEAATINLSGRQRMLSQRISRFALQSVSAETPADRQAALPQLSEAIAALNLAHDTLTAGESADAAPHRMSKALWQIYFGDPIRLDTQIRDYLAAGRRLAGRVARDPAADRADLKQLLDAASNPLLAGLDKVTREYQTESEAGVRLLRFLQYGLLTLTLLTLVGEVLLIFRPMVARIRRSQQYLESARAELQAVFDGVPDSIFVLDDTLVLRRTNHAAVRLWDSSADALIDQPVSRLLPAADLVLRTAMRRSEFAQTHELTAVRADGSRFPFECRLSERPEGGFLLTGRDVSERREQEHRLRLYESAFMNSTDPIVIFEDRSGSRRIESIAYVNPAFTQITGYQPGHVVGQGLTPLMPPETPDEVRQRITTALTARVPTQLETPLLRRDGSALWCELTFMPAPDAKGSIGHIVAIVRDISERRERERRAWEQGNLDLLTGLPNRRLFGERLRLVLEEAERQNTIAALMFIDLDGFKAINDRHGHDAGDQLLKIVAQRLTAAVRGTDVVSRLAGDEFTVICPQVTNVDEIEQIAQLILQRLSQPVELISGHARIGGSVGIALFPNDATTPVRLIKLADEAMYAAKSGGRNGYRFASRIGAAVPFDDARNGNASDT